VHCHWLLAHLHEPPCRHDPAWRYLIPIGFIGAYSTFSTYEWETLSTIRSGAFALASLYAVGSLILGLAAVWAVRGSLKPSPDSLWYKSGIEGARLHSFVKNSFVR